MVSREVAQFEEDERRKLSQASYKATEYADASWEIVGEVQSNEEFTPMAIDVVNYQQTGMIDGMFADYGGLSGPQKRRWHLPADQAHAAPAFEASEAGGEGLAPGEERLPLTLGEIEAMKEEAYQRGLDEGSQAAEASQTEAVEELSKRLQTVMADFQAQIKDELSRIEKEAVNLSLMITEKIIGYAVEINPEYIVSLTKDALALVGNANVHKVRVSAEDMEFIEVLGVAKGMSEYDGSWEFVADDTIKSGCVVETSSGEVDYRLDVAWERVRENVVKATK
jgi:flagellar assembly protein FliH